MPSLNASARPLILPLLLAALVSTGVSAHAQEEPGGTVLLTPHMIDPVPDELQAQTAVAAPMPPAPKILEGHVTRPGVAGPVAPEKSKLFGISDDLKVAEPVKKNTSVLGHASSMTKSVANFALDLRGFDWSKEGACAALDEKIDAKSEFAREYLKRRELDQREMNVVRAIFNIADSLHSKTAQSQIATQMATIQKEIGEANAIDAYNRVLEIDKTATTVPSESWSLADQDAKAKAIIEAAAEADPVVKDLKNRLHKYNSRSKALQISAKALYSACNIASMLPTVAAPIAGISQMTFMMATGGPEQDKLLKEVYLAKCLESRYKNLVEKTHLIASCQARAALTKNSTLLQCSKVLLKDMTDESVVASVFGVVDTSAVCANQAAPRQIATPVVSSQ